ncbi:MAG: hypothetical protein KF858_01300 [Candidatus Sumerlaeia bacterium]|nr:hypothetical protein [Candidatus Sumerlaeia bacterium]
MSSTVFVQYFSERENEGSGMADVRAGVILSESQLAVAEGWLQKLWYHSDSSRWIACRDCFRVLESFGVEMDVRVFERTELKKIPSVKAFARMDCLKKYMLMDRLPCATVLEQEHTGLRFRDFPRELWPEDRRPMKLRLLQKNENGDWVDGEGNVVIVPETRAQLVEILRAGALQRAATFLRERAVSRLMKRAAVLQLTTTLFVRSDVFAELQQFLDPELYFWEEIPAL